MSLNLTVQDNNTVRLPVKSRYGGATENQVYKYKVKFGLEYNALEPDPYGSSYTLNDIRIRTFMYHHFGMTSNVGSVGYYNTAGSNSEPNTEFTWNGNQIPVLSEYQTWRNELFPPRIHDNRFCVEYSFRPNTVGSYVIDNTPTKSIASNAQIAMVGIGQGSGGSSQIKTGRFFDCENSYSYITPSSVVTNPSNILLEYKISSKTRTISSIQVVGSEVTVTTSTTHPYQVGDAITVRDVPQYFGISVNRNALVTWVNTSNTQFKYTTKCYFLAGFPETFSASSGYVDYYVVMRGDVPSLSIAANYVLPSTVIPNVNDHTQYTYLRHALRDTSIGYAGGQPISIDYSMSVELPQQYRNSPLTVYIPVIKFDKPNTYNGPYMAEVGVFNIQGNASDIPTRLAQLSSDNWLATSTWSTIYPYIDSNNNPTNPLYDLVANAYYNSNDTDEWAYNRFIVGDLDVDWVDDGGGSVMIERWLNGVTSLDLAFLQAPNTSATAMYELSRDNNSPPNQELTPYIVITNGGGVSDTIPPDTTLVDADIYLKITSITGSTNKATVVTSSINYLSTGSFISIFGTGLYDGFEYEITSIINSTEFVVAMVGNVDTTVISGGYIRKDTDWLIQGQGTDDIQMANVAVVRVDDPHIPIAIEYSTLINPSLLSFGAVIPSVSEGYFDMSTQDNFNNWSSLIDPPVVTEYYKNISSVWTKDSQHIRTGDIVLIRGFNISSYDSSFSYVAGDTSFGGHNTIPITTTINNTSLLPANQGFTFIVPPTLQSAFTVSSVNVITNQITLLNAPTVNIGSLIVFNCDGVMYDPLVVGKTYYVLTSTPSGLNRIITISESAGGSVVNILATSGVGNVIAYNNYFPLSTIRDGYDGRTYNNYVMIHIDDNGPMFRLPTLMYLGDVIVVRVSDPCGIDMSSFSIIGGIINSMNDINADGNTIDLTITLTNTGTFSLTSYDLAGNSTTHTNTIAGLGGPVITVDSITVLNRDSFIMVGRVIDDNISVQYATDINSRGVFIAGSLCQSIGSTVVTAIPEGLRFTTTITSRGDGVLRIYSMDDDGNVDTMLPLILTEVDPICCNTGDTTRMYGMNLGHPTTDLALYAVDATIASPTSMMYRDALITSVIDGVYPVVLIDTLESDYVISNALSMTVDNTPPIINFVGDQNIYVEHGSGPYVDSGITAFDVISGVLTGSSISVTGLDAVDTNTIGVYPITYIATDYCGNSTTALRLVIVYGGELVIDIPTPSGSVGDVVEIIATTCEFNAIPINNVVTFNGVIAQVVGGDVNSLMVIVPQGASTGTVQVETFTDACGISNAVMFTVKYDDIAFNAITLPNTDSRGILAKTLGNAIYNRDISFSNFTEIIDENSMVQNVYNILLTNVSERIFNVGFGCRIQSYVFKPMSNIGKLSEDLLNEAISAISSFEKRVLVDTNTSAVITNPDTNDIYLILSLLVPSGNRRELGISLKSYGGGV